MKKLIDLRSDTITRPSASMYRAMTEARVGDDVYGEDPTVNELETRAAQILGMEAALFVPSGTMANQIAAMVHTVPGQEVITHAASHIFLYEGGGLGRLAGLQVHIVQGERGFFSKEDLKAAIRGDNIHFPRTALMTLENTINRAGGRVLSPEEYAPHLELCREEGIPVHLDGARIFNAALALDLTVEDMARGFDSVAFCLSKGLGAPVGSMLGGDTVFIKEARRMRKLLGGGMRQAGVLAAAGLIALEEGPEKLQRDHAMAQALAQGLEELPGFSLVYPVESNIIVLQETTGMTGETLAGKLKEKNVLVNPFGAQAIRLVTHRDLPDDAVERALKVFREL